MDSIGVQAPIRIQHFKDLFVAKCMKRLFVFALLLTAAGCASSDYDDRPQSQPRRPMADVEQVRDGSMLLPPADWWRQAQIADAVKPTTDQMTALDKLQSEQGDEIARLQRDLGVAERDLRSALDQEKASSDEIIAAGQRLRALRDDVFGRQLKYLAAQRMVLSRAQWDALQDAIRQQRRERVRDNFGGRGGRGGYPRGGRRPGGVPW